MFKAKLSALLAGAVALGVIALAVPAAHANLITCGTGLNCNLGSTENFTVNFQRDDRGEHNRQPPGHSEFRKLCVFEQR